MLKLSVARKPSSRVPFNAAARALGRPSQAARSQRRPERGHIGFWRTQYSPSIAPGGAPSISPSPCAKPNAAAMRHPPASSTPPAGSSVLATITSDTQHPRLLTPPCLRCLCAKSAKSSSAGRLQLAESSCRVVPMELARAVSRLLPPYYALHHIP